MLDSLPFANQLYSNSIFKIAAYKLVEQEPGLVSLTLDSITSKLSGRVTPVLFKEVLPMSENTLLMNEITIHYPHKKKVTYYWICKKIIQLLLWTESKRAINLDEIWENTKIRLRETNENIIKIQQIISDYSNHLTSEPELLGFDRLCSIERTTLPSYKNAVSDRDIVGTSNAHLTPRNQQKQNFFAVKGHAPEHNFNNSSSDNSPSYCFDGSDKTQARSFINDYICLAIRNRWNTENKIEYFKDYLEKDALEWYLSYNIRSLTSWKCLKNEFARKYFN